MERNIGGGMTRRCFVGTLAGGAAAAAFAGTETGDPDLKVGILSDVHLSPPDIHQSQGAIDMFEKTLGFFRKEKVDAVLIAGDLTNGGTMREMRVLADSWKKVFGDGPGAPEKIFVTGNHEKVYHDNALKKGDLKARAYVQGLYNGIEKNWRELFGEEWSPFFIKTVKGYSFVGAHWLEWYDRKAFAAFLEKHREKLSSDKPFFYTQHAHPQDTCYGKWTWHQWEGGPTSEVLASWPNAVAFSGHTHYSLTDQRSVWQGAFTSLGTASLRWLSLPAGRENGPLYGFPSRMRQMCWGSQGMVMNVWRDRMVFERWDFVNMEKLGDDWTLPVLHGPSGEREYSFGKRAALMKIPEFPAGAKITVSEGEGWNSAKKGEKERQVTVSFPTAGGSDDMSRVFDYAVTAEVVDHDITRVWREKRVYQFGAQLNAKRAKGINNCVFGADELPPAGFRFSVTPLNSFGARGKPISVDYRKQKV